MYHCVRQCPYKLSILFAGADDWNQVLIECSSLASKWELISAYLGLPISVIDTIKLNHPTDVQGCWNEALKQWITQCYDIEKFDRPSWQRLLKAIAMVDTLQFTRLAAHHQGSTA